MMRINKALVDKKLIKSYLGHFVHCLEKSHLNKVKVGDTVVIIQQDVNGV